MEPVIRINPLDTIQSAVLSCEVFASNGAGRNGLSHFESERTRAEVLTFGEPLCDTVLANNGHDLMVSNGSKPNRGRRKAHIEVVGDFLNDCR